MSYSKRLAHMSLSELEDYFKELTRLQKENLTTQFEIAETKAAISRAIELAQIESRVYSGIKRFFKKERS